MVERCDCLVGRLLCFMAVFHWFLVDVGLVLVWSWLFGVVFVYGLVP
ncbi:MAG: hypothetical protein IKY94_16340 [Lachnospiraceae bacterium]|nr:hypothetical protein [Lachnospiraceae bacterium]